MSADALSEILQFVPPSQRRYLGRSLSHRYHQETEMLAAELVQSKSWPLIARRVLLRI